MPTSPFPVPVRVDGLWGTQTIRIGLPREYVGSSAVAVDPPMTEWQKVLADEACGARR